MSRYISKPQVIEAVQWTGDNEADIAKFMSRPPFDWHSIRSAPTEQTWGFDVKTELPDRVDPLQLRIKAGKDGAQDWVPVPVGHWIVRSVGDMSDHWPVDPDYFAAKYEPYTTVHADDFFTTPETPTP